LKGSYRIDLHERNKGGIVAISIVRLGTRRVPHEGLRIGTVRHPPRGVPKAEFAKRDYYDVWFPNLSPSSELVKEAQAARDERAWSQFRRKFRREMSQPAPSRELDLFAALSHQVDFAIGCYCEDESRCHRSVLRELLLERGADLAVSPSVAPNRSAAPAGRTARGLS
jgi:uncharacterized protein YeaO (DUF488 family)